MILTYKTDVTVLNAKALFGYFKCKHDKNELPYQHFAYTAIIFIRVHYRRISGQDR